MTRKLIFWVVATFTLSIGVVAALISLSKDIRERPGSFLRQYPAHPVMESTKIKLPDNNFYFAGATQDNIYLAHYLKPLQLLEIKSDMSDTTFIRLKIDGMERSRYVRITVALDSPYYYVMDGAIPYIYRGNISDWVGAPYMTDSAYFIDAIPISPTSFAIRALSGKTHEYALGKLIVNDTVKLNNGLLEKQFDGLFDVNGSFYYNAESKRISFVYYYRNQYMVMDTNMNLAYRGHTIDTFRIGQINSAQVHSENSVLLSSPPLVTNKFHATYNSWLFIHSLLPAKNELMEYFNKASVVDVYDLNTQAYLFSFYLFDEDGEKLKEFRFVHGSMYVLYPNSIRRFDMMKQYFPDEPS